MQSSQITESVAHPDLSPRFRRCTTQAVVTTLKLSERLWIRKDFLAYQSKQVWRDQNCYKICRYAVQAVADSDDPSARRSQQCRRASYR